MKTLATTALLLVIHQLIFAQLPSQHWSITQDTLTDNIYHYHKNLALSSTGLSAALSSRNGNDQLEVYETDGSVRYAKSFEQDQCWYYHVEFASDDALYLIGTNQPQSQQGSSTRIQKLDANGNVLWTTHWLENATEYTGVIRTHTLSDGRIVICGQFNFYNANSSNDFYILCITPDGAIDWTYVYSSNGVITDILRNSYVDGNDHIYFTGIRQNAFLTSYYDLIAGKLDSDGNLLWTVDLDYTNFNGQSVDAESVVVDANGRVLLAANTFTYNQQDIPISLPIVARLNGNDGSALGIAVVPFQQSAVIKELIADTEGNYYANFTASRDSIYFITPEFYELVTYEVSHHVMKWDSSDQLLWSYDEVASAQLTSIETYDMLLYNNQLMVFNYFENNNRILCLTTSGSPTDIYTYPRPVIHIGTYQHHILANNHGVYLYCGSTQISASFRPYYVLVRFSNDPDFVASTELLNLLVYPNPAKNFVMIADLPADAQVRMLDSSGRPISLQRQGTKIAWTRAATGIYVIEIVYDSQQQRQRIMVE